MTFIALRALAGAACVAAVLTGAGSAALAQSAPFAGLEGQWAGTGSVELADGSSERIRCRATYRVGGGGSGLEQTLRCASDSYKMDISSTLQSQGGNITGQWQETSRNINGSVTGRASAGQINVLVEAAGFAANLTVATRGNKQQVGITSKGDIRNVNITLSKV